MTGSVVMRIVGCRTQWAHCVEFLSGDVAQQPGCPFKENIRPKKLKMGLLHEKEIQHWGRKTEPRHKVEYADL